MTPRETWELPTRHVGRRVFRYDRLPSTSDVAAALAEQPGHDGVAVLADEQTAGRGQHGRSWSCPAGSGVLMSVLLFPPPELRRPVLMTAWAAVAVADLAHELTGREPRIKWPNDVQIERKKVCGILIEQRRGLVAGIGLNVNQSADDFAAAGLPDAASLAVFSGRQRDVTAVARRLLHQLDDHYAALCAGDFGSLEASWRRRLGLLDEDVRAETLTGPVLGRLRELTWDAVVLDGQAGVVRLAPEMVRHLSPASSL